MNFSLKTITAKCALSLLVISSLLFTSCGYRVEVTSTEVGKIKTEDGFQSGIKKPSSFRLPVVGPGGVLNYLYTVETCDQAFAEPMTVFMPEDQLNLEFELRGTLSIKDDESTVNYILDNVTAKGTSNERKKCVPFIDVYNTYGQQIVKTAAREVIAGKSIEFIMANRESVSTDIEAAMRLALKDTPFTLLRAHLADVQPPGVIIKAKEKAKEREIAIQQAEADRQVRMKEAEADLEVARKRQEVDLIEAETQVLVEQKLKEAVSPAYIAQRGLKILDDIAKSDNAIVLLPTEALTNPAVMIGVVDQMMSAAFEDSRTAPSQLPDPEESSEKGKESSESGDKNGEEKEENR